MEILNCEIHGDHEVKEQEIMGRTFRFTKCPKCSEESRIEEDRKRVEEDKKPISIKHNEQTYNSATM